MVSQTSFHGSGNVVNDASFIPGAIGDKFEEFCLVLFSVTSLVSIENLVNSNAQCICDPYNRFQAGVLDACFDMADVGDGHSGLFCQISLGHFLAFRPTIQDIIVKTRSQGGVQRCMKN